MQQLKLTAVSTTCGKSKSRSSSRPETRQEQVDDDDMIIAKALTILETRARYGDSISSPAAARDLCRLRLGGLEHEVFAVLYLDAQNRMIAFDELFRGTLTQTSVYPREVVKAALAHNAAAVIVTHNHPSGTTDPSRADENITRILKDALALVDVKVLDHIVVSTTGITSFAECGRL